MNNFNSALKYLFQAESSSIYLQQKDNINHFLPYRIYLSIYNNISKEHFLSLSQEEIEDIIFIHFWLDLKLYKIESQKVSNCILKYSLLLTPKIVQGIVDNVLVEEKYLSIVSKELTNKERIVAINNLLQHKYTQDDLYKKLTILIQNYINQLNIGKYELDIIEYSTNLQQNNECTRFV